MMPWRVFNTCAASVDTMFIKTYGNLPFVRSLTAIGEPTNSMDQYTVTIVKGRQCNEDSI